jgi:hypothetical protein
MLTKKFAALIFAPALIVSLATAGADKACLKTAKADYKTATDGCKDKKGAEKKSCTKDAKAAYKTAKAACSAPAATPAADAPATEPAPATPAAQ